MNYVVRPLARVTSALRSAERWVQDEFEHICSILAINPYPNPQFPLITEDRTVGGERYYTYSDDWFPFAIQYIVQEPTDDDDGAIVVFGLKPIAS